MIEPIQGQWNTTKVDRARYYMLGNNPTMRIRRVGDFGLVLFIPRPNLRIHPVYDEFVSYLCDRQGWKHYDEITHDNYIELMLERGNNNEEIYNTPSTSWIPSKR